MKLGDGYMECGGCIGKGGGAYAGEQACNEWACGIFGVEAVQCLVELAGNASNCLAVGCNGGGLFVHAKGRQVLHHGVDEHGYGGLLYKLAEVLPGCIAILNKNGRREYGVGFGIGVLVLAAVEFNLLYFGHAGCQAGGDGFEKEGVHNFGFTISDFGLRSVRSLRSLRALRAVCFGF